ncbi:putative microtubule-associated protein [Erysiphe necator]|uniref:Mediator of RNA polymerase II transcription subunit 9 n=1 Tax=Uncinula necator TaxID=52586 RepID=A0A0B1PDG5_UNCNE|nr:putative microtubule-associated protein [Erysiphe necator]
MMESISTSTSSDIPSVFKLPEGLSPNSIDTVPVLSSLLSRFQTSQLNSSISASGLIRSTASPSQLLVGTGPLTDKDITSATDVLRLQLQKAHMQIGQFPDMHRSIEEQELEIKELESKILKQKDTISEIQKFARVSKKLEEKIEENSVSLLDSSMDQ